MKKAKMMLTALAVLAVVGGGLAFKSAKFSRTTFYSTSPARPLTCDVPFLATTKNTTPNIDIAATLVKSAPCVDFKLTTIEP
jgi:hypothetical protein